jgi:prevent-host-death family protein
VRVASAGIRQLKNDLSRYIRRVEAGERIAVTAHGRVVAELVPPGAASKARPIRLPAGTAAALIDADRGEA